MRALTGAQSIVLAALGRAAELGEKCPTSMHLAELIGSASASSGTEILLRLEYYGLITVQRFAASRIVTIVATGKSTAGEPGKPHWRQAGASGKIWPKRSGNPRGLVRLQDEEDIPPRVDRDPCPRCGTRADFGCTHQPSSLAGAA